jgi:uncharacterized membrane protein
MPGFRTPAFKTQSEEKMETQMGSILRIGVLTSCLIMFAGAVLYLLGHGGERESYASFQGEPASLRSISGVLREARLGGARGIIQVGVLAMIATPVMRVAFAVFGFARQKQWRFTLISLTVLGLLAFGLFDRG